MTHEEPRGSGAQSFEAGHRHLAAAEHVLPSAGPSLQTYQLQGSSRGSPVELLSCKRTCGVELRGTWKELGIIGQTYLDPQSK